MKLIPEIREAWKFASVRFGALAVAWGLVPAEQQVAMLQWVGISQARVPAVLGALFLLTRITSFKAPQ